MSDDITIEQVGKAAVSVAKREWSEVVRDPQDAETIEEYHEAIGAGWAVENGYEESEDYWCGVFAAFCFCESGDFLGEITGDKQCLDLRLHEDISGTLFMSTLKLAGRWQKSWEDFGFDKPQIIDPHDVQPGDIAVVHTDREDEVWGDHITLVKSRAKKHSNGFQTYEGNAYGRLGNDEQGEGVIRHFRKYSEVATIYRLLPQHFVGEASERLVRGD